MKRISREDLLFDGLPLLVAVVGIELIWRGNPMLDILIKFALAGYGLF